MTFGSVPPFQRTLRRDSTAERYVVWASARSKRGPALVLCSACIMRLYIAYLLTILYLHTGPHRIGHDPEFQRQDDRAGISRHLSERIPGRLGQGRAPQAEGDRRSANSQ